LLRRVLPEITTTLTDMDVTRILHKSIWCGRPPGCILFGIGVKEEAANPECFWRHKGQPNGSDCCHCSPKESKVSTLFHVYYLKRMSVNGNLSGEAIFVKRHGFLRAVARGIDEPLPRVTSHELGHAFGLPHRQDTTNLMLQAQPASG